MRFLNKLNDDIVQPSQVKVLSNAVNYASARLQQRILAIVATAFAYNYVQKKKGLTELIDMMPFDKFTNSVLQNYEDIGTQFDSDELKFEGIRLKLACFHVPVLFEKLVSRNKKCVIQTDVFANMAVAAKVQGNNHKRDMEDVCAAASLYLGKEIISIGSVDKDDDSLFLLIYAEELERLASYDLQQMLQSL